MIRVSDLLLNGREFDPRPPHYRSVGTGMGDRLRAGEHTTSVCNQPPRPTQPSIHCGTLNEHWPTCGDALQLGSRVGRLIPFVDKPRCRWQVKLCDRSLTRTILSVL